MKINLPILRQWSNTIIFLLFLFIGGCKNTSQDGTEAKKTSSFNLSERGWSCLNALNESLPVRVSLVFSSNGMVDAHEGSGYDISCQCNGNYSLSSENKSLTISGISNNNCPWMSKLNGNYVYQNDGAYEYFANGNIKLRRMIY